MIHNRQSSPSGVPITCSSVIFRSPECFTGGVYFRSWYPLFCSFLNSFCVWPMFLGWSLIKLLVILYKLKYRNESYALLLYDVSFISLLVCLTMVRASVGWLRNWNTPSSQRTLILWDGEWGPHSYIVGKKFNWSLISHPWPGLSPN